MTTISQFLESEKKENSEWFRENHTALRNMNVDEAHILYAERASAHDSRLIAHLREILPNPKMHQLPDDVGSPHETEHDRGWNEYRETLLSLLTDTK